MVIFYIAISYEKCFNCCRSIRKSSNTLQRRNAFVVCYQAFRRKWWKHDGYFSFGLNNMKSTVFEHIFGFLALQFHAFARSNYFLSVSFVKSKFRPKIGSYVHTTDYLPYSYCLTWPYLLVLNALINGPILNEDNSEEIK